MMRRLASGLAALAGCAATSLAPPASSREEWPRTDFSRRSVDLNEIVSGGPSKDGIPAINQRSAMPIVAAKPLRSYPWFIRLFFWKQRRTYGRVLDSGFLWGRSPWVFSSVALLYGALDRRSSPLAPALRSLVTVRVSQINHCAFCVDISAARQAWRPP